MPSATSQPTPQQSTAADTMLGLSVNTGSADVDRPDWRDPISRAQLATWQKCRDAYEGTDALLDQMTREGRAATKEADHDPQS